MTDEIADLLQREGLSQKALALRAGVAQSTVSRALQRPPARQTEAYARLCSYMHQHAVRAHAPADQVLEAVRKTWDGSEEHAAALANLILASRELWPTLGKEIAP